MSLWLWLKHSENQKTLAFIGGCVTGLVGLISALVAILVQIGVFSNGGGAVVAGNGQGSPVPGGTTIKVEIGGAGHTVTTVGRDQYIGIQPDQLPAILAAARGDWNDLSDEQRASISGLEGKLGGVSQRAVLAFFKAIDEAQVPLEQLEARLLEIAEAYRRALTQAAPGPGDTLEIAGLKAGVRAALEAGELELADELLERLLALEDAAIEDRQIQAAATAAQRGDLALTRLRYLEAADHFKSAAKRVSESRAVAALSYLDRAANALLRQGNEFGDNAALEAAIDAYRSLLNTSARGLIDWAATQNNLGRALAMLGERESDTARLEEAVKLFRAALEEHSRERDPLDWAMTQSNLGRALLILGERESDTARLEEAVKSFRAALEEHTRERDPLDWAETQRSLGSALLILGERESDTARLEEAVKSFRAALEEHTRERVPLNWAMAQNNLGNALIALGACEGSAARLDEAVQAYRAALEEHTRERVPLNWAMTQSNLGNALSIQGRLEEAVEAHRAALKEYTRERVPLDWAASQNNLGTALAALGAREGRAARFEEAVQAYREALEERTRERNPLGWAMIQNNLARALAILGELKSDTARLEEAVNSFRAALEEQTRERDPFAWAITQSRLGRALTSLGERESGTARLEEAVAAYRAALNVFGPEGATRYALITRTGLENAEAMLAGRRGS